MNFKHGFRLLMVIGMVLVLSTALLAAPKTERNCDNDKDDDKDGYFDCEDLDCSNDPVCSGSELPEIRFITTYWDFEYGYNFFEQYWTCKREVTNQHGRYYACPYGDHPGQTIQLPNLSDDTIFPATQLLKGGDETLCRRSELDGAQAIITGMLQGFSEDCGIDTCQSGSHTGFLIEGLPGYKLGFVATDYSVESDEEDPFTQPQVLEMEELVITFRKDGTMRKLAQCRYDLREAELKMKLHVSPCDDPFLCEPAP